MRFEVVVYNGHHCFGEVARAVHDCLLRLGHETLLTTESLRPITSSRVIAFGTNLLRRDQFLPDDAIIVNGEVMSSNWWPVLLPQFNGRAVWDWSEGRVAELRRQHYTAIHLPLGYHDVFDGPPDPIVKREGVTFIGSRHHRRTSIFSSIGDLRFYGDVWGNERTKLLQRSLVGLNVHYHEPTPGEVETLRILMHLTHGAPVVCETSSGLDVEWLKDGLLLSAYEDLPGACAALLKDDDLRRMKAKRGYEAFRTGRPPFIESVKEAVARS